MAFSSVARRLLGLNIIGCAFSLPASADTVTNLAFPSDGHTWTGISNSTLPYPGWSKTVGPDGTNTALAGTIQLKVDGTHSGALYPVFTGQVYTYSRYSGRGRGARRPSA
jgi:hypothetical protein